MASPTLGWHTITRAELRAWDDDMADVAMEATGYGWEGKFSNRGHLLMRSPDGRHTMSVSKKAAKSSLQNTRADLGRWKKSQPGASFGAPAVRAAAGVEDVFADGGPQFVAEMPADILAYLHRDGRVVEYMRHLLDDDVNVDEVKQRLTLATQDDPDTLTVAGPWVVLDRLTHRAIAWGSDMTEADAYALIYGPGDDDDTGSEDRQMTDETPAPQAPSEPDDEKERDDVATQIIRTWGCDVCGQTFDKGNAYAAHSQAHLKPKKCVICGKQVKYMDTHLRRQHSHLPQDAQVYAHPVDRDTVEKAHEFMRTMLLELDETRALREHVTRLEAENATLRAENQELRAKIDVIKEGLGL